MLFFKFLKKELLVIEFGVICPLCLSVVLALTQFCPILHWCRLEITLVSVLYNIAKAQFCLIFVSVFT